MPGQAVRFVKVELLAVNVVVTGSRILKVHEESEQFG